MSQTISKFSVSRELSPSELDSLKNELAKNFPDITKLEITPLKSLGLSGAEILISIAISLAANTTYDIGKFVVKYLSERNIKASDVDEE